MKALPTPEISETDVRRATGIFNAHFQYCRACGRAGRPCKEGQKLQRRMVWLSLERWSQLTNRI